jgi:hypothetical protein
MIGETTTTGDVAPVMTGAPILSNPAATASKRRVPTGKPGKQKPSNLKKRSRTAGKLIGEDSRDGYVIPDDAKEIDTMDVSSDGLANVDKPELPGEKIKNPYSGEEPLILPAASLVAPDVTPKAISPLDPSQLPGADRGVPPQAAAPAPAAPATPAATGAESPVVDLMLGKSPAQPAAPVSAESAMSRLPGVMSPDQYAAAEKIEESGLVGEATLSQGQPMPEHVHPGTAANVMNAFSQFIPRGSVKINE